MFTSHKIDFCRFSSLLLAATIGFAAAGCHAASQGGIASGARHASTQRDDLLAAAFIKPASFTGDASCIRIERAGNSEVADTQLSELRKERNYGLDPSSRIGASELAEYRTLVAFDLHDVPHGATVTQATMSLVRRTGGRSHISLHRITDTWNEHEATWSSFGNAYDLNAEATIQLDDASEEGRVSFDVTRLVQSWASGEYPNEGVMVQDSKGHSMFGMSESFAAMDHPRLEVCFVGAHFASKHENRVASR